MTHNPCEHVVCRPKLHVSQLEDEEKRFNFIRAYALLVHSRMHVHVVDVCVHVLNAAMSSVMWADRQAAREGEAERDRNRERRR